MEKIKSLLSGNKDDTTTASTTHSGGLAGEGSHLQDATHTTGTGVGHSTGYPTESGVANTAHTGATSGQGTHFGSTRDNTNINQTPGLPGQFTAAGSGLGNTGGGLGSGNVTTGPHDSNLANKADPRVDSHRGTGVIGGSSGISGNHNTIGLSSGNTTTGPHDSNIANRADPLVDSNRSAGLSGNGQSSGLTGSNTGGLPLHSGPHSTAVANALDPSLDSRGGYKLEPNDHHSEIHGGGAEQADHHHTPHVTSSKHGDISSAPHLGSDTTFADEHSRAQGISGFGGSSTTGEHDRHIGRNAGIAGGIGAAGAAGYEAEKHHHNSGTTTGHGPFKVDAATAAGPPTVGGLTSNPAHHGIHNEGTTGHGPFKVDAATASGPPTTGGHTANPSHHGIKDATNDKHLGRNAGIAGGLGAAGYEAEKHQDVKRHPGHTLEHPRETHANTYDVDPAAGSQTKDHHLGRDAAVVGGVGGAAYEADKHHHDKSAEKELKKEHKHEVKEAKREEKHEHKEHKQGFISKLLHRDKNKKYTKEEEAEFDRQERDHNSHNSRNAALGGAAAGGAYEAEKHHSHHDATDKPLPTAPGNHGIGTGAGTQNALASDKVHSGQLVGEHKNANVHGTPLSDKPIGQDIGDKLHGSERNRGVPGPTGFPHEHGAGHTGAGSTGLGSNQHNTSSGLPGTHEHGAGHTGVGSTGLGSSQHNTSSGLPGTHEPTLRHTQPNIGGDERNRLHKDPPGNF